MDSVDNVIYIWLFLMFFIVISLFRRNIIRKIIQKERIPKGKEL